MFLFLIIQASLLTLNSATESESSSHLNCTDIEDCFTTTWSLNQKHSREEDFPIRTKYWDTSQSVSKPKDYLTSTKFHRHRYPRNASTANETLDENPQDQGQSPASVSVSGVGFKCPIGASGGSTTNPKTRTYPFCVGKNTLEEYQNNLPGYALVEDILTFQGSKLEDVPVAVTNSPSHGYKNVKEVQYSIVDFHQFTRITFSKKLLFHSYALHNWFHMKITTKKPVKVLIVQANVLPYAMPYGNFDIEFACNDCHDGAVKRQYGDPDRYEDQLAFKDRRAAIIPCFRRTHLHMTHPDIYVFASETPMSEFHFHYRFFDVTCRETKYIQFMIANKQVDGTLEAFYTALIDHDHVHHNRDGTPLPMIHKDSVPYNTCHKQPIFFTIPRNGNWFMAIYPEYEKCLIESEKNCDYKEDKTTYQSDYVCSGKSFPIKRTLCPFDDTVEPDECFGFDGPSATFNQCGKSGEVCGNCSIFENPWQDELYRRLIRRSYIGRRTHGLLMILGTIGLANISIHIARYFKETEGGIILVGCWLWAHFGISILSVFPLWVAAAEVLQIPRRGYHVHEKFLPYQLSSEYNAKRDFIIKIHYGIGLLTFILFHFIVAFGAVRPSTGLNFWVLSHAVVGYLMVVLGALSTWISTACLETKIWTTILILISIGPWIAAQILQVFQDRNEKTDRKYFPVLEAISIVVPMPDGRLRAALLGLLTFLTYVFLVIAAVKSDYTGIILNSPCKNCPYKYDEIVLHTFESPVSSTLFVLEKYHCEEKDFPGVFNQ